MAQGPRRSLREQHCCHFARAVKLCLCVSKPQLSRVLVFCYGYRALRKRNGTSPEVLHV